eukprot:m.38290 g.38290  ORF g.38290 m.38290 type:complete len:479 (-) comp11474_c0_seq3:127-1563(-)
MHAFADVCALKYIFHTCEFVCPDQYVFPLYLCLYLWPTNDQCSSSSLLSEQRQFLKLVQWWMGSSEHTNLCLYAFPDPQSSLVRVRDATISQTVQSMSVSKLDPRILFLLLRDEPSREGFSYTYLRCSGFTEDSTLSARRVQKAKAAGLQEHFRVRFLLSSPICLASPSPDDQNLVVVSQQGHIHLVNLATRSKMTHNAAEIAVDPVSLAWHPSSAFFALALRKGAILLYDRALNPLRWSVLLESMVAGPLLDLAVFGLTFSGVANAYWATAPRIIKRTPTEVGKMLFDSEELVIQFSGSPPAVVRFESSAALHGSGHGILAGLCIEHLRQGATRQAIRLLKEMDWMTTTDASYHVLATIIDDQLKTRFSDDSCDAIEMAVPAFVWNAHPDVPLEKVRDVRNRIIKLLWRYFDFLILQQAYVRALKLAARLESKDMCRVLVDATNNASAVGDVVVNTLATRIQHLTSITIEESPESTV